MKLLTLVFLIFVSSSSAASAVDLVNRDNGGYEVEVTSTSGTTSTSINPLTVKNNICSNTCEIKVKGVGTIKATGSETVSIENGALSKNYSKLTTKVPHDLKYLRIKK